jgi:hypothetical protein
MMKFSMVIVKLKPTILLPAGIHQGIPIYGYAPINTKVKAKLAKLF